MEDLSLMQSYHDVKREGKSTKSEEFSIYLQMMLETIRRSFHRWLTATRTARYRRLALQQCEEQLRQKLLQLAWGKWREHARAIFLKPLVLYFTEIYKVDIDFPFRKTLLRCNLEEIRFSVLLACGM